MRTLGAIHRKLTLLTLRCFKSIYHFPWSHPLELYIVGLSSMSRAQWYSTWPSHLTFQPIGLSWLHMCDVVGVVSSRWVVCDSNSIRWDKSGYIVMCCSGPCSSVASSKISVVSLKISVVSLKISVAFCVNSFYLTWC